MKKLVMALVALAFALASGSADAKGNKNKSKGKAKADKVVVKSEGERRVVFVDADRTAYRSWWRSTYGTNCPPGLAKKDNG